MEVWKVRCDVPFQKGVRQGSREKQAEKLKEWGSEKIHGGKFGGGESESLEKLAKAHGSLV
jgi:hypothetical protein